MMKRVLIAIAVGVLFGVVAGVVWGQRLGTIAGIAAALVGVIAAVLVRNQKDLDELQHGHVPEPIDRALGDTDHEGG